MKGLLLGMGVAVALAALEGDASAGLADEAPLSRSASAGATHGMTLAKAKKRRRAPAPGAKAEPADDAAGGDDDAPSKSAAASSDSSDEAKEAELFGSSKPKKRPASPPAASDEGAASDSPSPPKARPKTVDETVETKASEESSDASPQSALEFGLGFKALFRSLAWTQPDGRAAGLGPYSLSPGPQTGLWLEFYPAAFGSSGFAANVGVIASFNYGFGVATTLANDDVVETKFRDFLAGVKLRVPFGGFVPNLSLAYGQQVFSIAQQMTMQDLPQLAYQFVRFAPGARMFFTPTVVLDVGAAYLLVLDPGSGANSIRDPNRFFPKATAFGFDVTASLAFRLTGSIGARAGADLRAYTISNNQNTRGVVGAVDRYITVWAGLEVVLDGQGAAAGGDDDEPAKPSKRKRGRRAEPKDDDESEDSDSKSEDE